MHFKQKKILVLTSTYPRYTGDNEPPFVKELSRHLSEHYQVHVVCPNHKGGKTNDRFRRVKITRFRYCIPRWELLSYNGGILANLRKNKLTFLLVPFFILSEMICLITILKREKIDLIHAHWIFPQGWVALIARRLAGISVPVLCTVHGGDLFGLRGLFFGMIKKYVLKGVDAVSVVSKALRDGVMAYGVDSKNIFVIPMGVDLSHKFTPQAHMKNKHAILSVGRLVEKKGIGYLLDAMPTVIQSYPKTILKIIGDGPLAETLKQKAIKLGISDHVMFLGAMVNDRLPGHYQTADIFVFPSIVSSDGDREGFGLVLVEALGCGCTCVVTDLPAMQDIVQDGSTALVVPEKNSYKIAESIVKLFEQPELALKLARKGQQFVLKRFDWKVIGVQYKVLIDKIIGG